MYVICRTRPYILSNVGFIADVVVWTALNSRHNDETWHVVVPCDGRAARLLGTGVGWLVYAF